MPDQPPVTPIAYPPRASGWNEVAFAIADGPTIYLALEADYVYRPGVEPCYVTGRCGYAQYDLIRGNVIGRAGDVLFYWSSGAADRDYADRRGEKPAAPDLVLKDFELVEVGNVEYGHEVEGVAGDNPRFRPVVYRLILADRRRGLVAFRGGYLDQGEFNKLPIDRAGKDANGRGLIGFKQELKMILAAMGLANELAVPAELGDFPKTFNIEWRGNAAPAELDKRLRECGYVLHLNPDGKYALAKMGTGDDPKIDAALLIKPAPKTVGGIDRRTKGVVFSSHPNPVLDTVTLTPDGGDPDLEWVVNDGGKWRAVTEADVQNLQNGVIDPRLRMYLYRAFRLVEKKFGTGPVLRQPVTISGGQLVPGDFDVRGWTVLPDATGVLYANSSGPIPLTVSHLLENGRVVLLRERVGRMKLHATSGGPARYDIPSGDPDFFFEAPQAGDFSVTLTREVYREDKVATGEDPKFLPEYAFVGAITGDDGRPRKMTEQELVAFLAKASREFPVVPRPDLVEYRRDGRPVNRGELESIALSIAQRWIPSQGDEVRVVEGRGWFPIGPYTGKTTEVVITQTPPKVSFRLGSFYLPSSQYLVADKSKGAAKAAGEKFSGQAETAAPRAVQGAAGAATAAPVMPAGEPPRVKAFQGLWVELGTPGDGDGGTNGSFGVAPSYKYKVSLNGQVIAAKEEPLVRRGGTGPFLRAGYGWAFFDTAGRVRLAEAIEIEQIEPCAGGGS